MKIFLIISVIFMATACAVKREHARTDAYPSSPPSCSTHSDEIDCQWKDVPVSWHRAAETFSSRLSPPVCSRRSKTRPLCSRSFAVPHSGNQRPDGKAACDSDGDYPLITSLQYWHSRQQSVPYAAYSWHHSEVTGWARASIRPLATLSGFWDR